jgi:gas vesicle protein
MHTIIRNIARFMARAAALLALSYLYRLQGVGMVDGVVAAARQQSRPRRWPWQPRTVRDYLDAYRAELAALATLQGAALLQAVQRQSRPRRWPWQKKTIRDLIDARSAEVVAAAAEWSADLAAEVAKRKDMLVAAAQQSQPRRWPWQKKTIRDRVSERSVELATIAAERGAQLAALAAERRDALVAAARRQSQPRRWPWQTKTARDHLDEQGTRAARRVGRTREQVQQQAAAAVPVVQQAVSTASERLSSLAEQSREAVQQMASATNSRAQELITAVPDALSAARAAADTLSETAQHASSTLSTTAASAASAVQRPVTALSSTVQAGQRTVRWGVRLLRAALWAALIGFALGLVFAPTSGAELRRRLRAIVDQVVRMLQSQSAS